jgi:hypothetical protein
MSQDPKFSSSPILPTLREQIEQNALRDHKVVDGEYGCPGQTCPGVQRLIRFYEGVARLTLDAVEAKLEEAVKAFGIGVIDEIEARAVIREVRAQLTAARPPHAAHEKDQGAL